MDILFQKVFKSFQGVSVLDGFDWKIKSRSQWQICGPSGVGKTTLLRLLLRLETPDAGRIVGNDTVRFSALFQENRLLESLSAQKNVEIVCRDKERARNCLHALLPKSSLQQRVSTLSGGMKRRVALARALAASSDVLVLDEPFTGLDAENSEIAADVIYRFLDHRTLIIVSHQQSTAFSHLETLRLAP